MCGFDRRKSECELDCRFYAAIASALIREYIDLATRETFRFAVGLQQVQCRIILVNENKRRCLISAFQRSFLCLDCTHT